MGDRILQEGVETFLEQERKRFEDVKGFLDANSESSARSRNLIVVLAVASVLTAMGVLNSMQSSWMVERFENLRNSQDEYLKKYVGACPIPANYPSKAAYDIEYDLYQRRYLAFMGAASGALVDNRYFIHVPFFGLAFDANDLGFLAGVGLVSVLLLLSFSSGTELENLRLSFKETQRLQCFREFYRLAAMRQVLTIPPLPGRTVRRLEKWLAKPVYFLPAGAYLWVLVHDLGTYGVGRSLDSGKTNILITSEFFFLAAILALALMCFVRSRNLDRTWQEGWLVYNDQNLVPASRIAPPPNLQPTTSWPG